MHGLERAARHECGICIYSSSVRAKQSESVRPPGLSSRRWLVAATLDTQVAKGPLGGASRKPRHPAVLWEEDRTRSEMRQRSWENTRSRRWGHLSPCFLRPPVTRFCWVRFALVALAQPGPGNRSPTEEMSLIRLDNMRLPAPSARGPTRHAAEARSLRWEDRDGCRRAVVRRGASSGGAGLAGALGARRTPWGWQFHLAGALSSERRLLPAGRWRRGMLPPRGRRLIGVSNSVLSLQLVNLTNVDIVAGAISSEAPLRNTKSAATTTCKPWAFPAHSIQVSARPPPAGGSTHAASSPRGCALKPRPLKSGHVSKRLVAVDFWGFLCVFVFFIFGNFCF